MDKKSTFGLKLEQLADLFSIGVEKADSTDGISDDKTIAGLLCGQLTSALPKDSFLLDSLLMMMGRLGCDTRALAGKSLGEILLDPGSDIGLLQAIKDYSKKLSCGLVSETETAIAITIYYAILASSLIYHDKKITQYSYEALGQSFAMLTKKKWMTPELKKLFSRARNICRDKRDDK
ncbi:MAG: hypothetical protein ACYTDW_03690 [Planctomycetota bacterium]|jgi:hypothetical protein